MIVPFRRLFRTALCGGCTVVFAACGDRGAPLSPPPPVPAGPSTPVLAGSLQCTASPRAGTVECSDGTLPRSARGYLIVGGQGTFVRLTSSNVAYDPVNQVFSFDVTVQNLIAQAMGTADGSTPEANGVRVVFASGPTVASGTGNVAVANADGVGAFTGASQPYFQYSGTTDLGADGVLTQNETSGARSWQLNVDATVGTFVFTLYVVAEVPFPNGWIDVGGATPNLLPGGAEALTAAVRTATGTLAGNQAVTWASGNTSVATVDAAGNVTAVAPGTATITATQGALSAGATVAVCPNLAVGGVFTADAATGASLCLPGGAAGNAEYTYIPVNLSQSTAIRELVVRGTGMVAASGPPTPDRLPIPPEAAGLRPAGEALQAASDVPFLEKDRPKLAALLRNPASRVRSRARTGGARGVITAGVVPAVGDSMDLNTNSACSGSPSVHRGVVRAVGLFIVVVEDTANPAGGFTAAQYDSITSEFDALVWPAENASFGAPTDLDGNERVVVFFTRAVNELTPPSSSTVVQGFFAPKDLFTADSANGCTNSNQGEVLYMLVPDPDGVVNGVARPVLSVRPGTSGTMAHELQHMINAGRRTYVTGAQSFEEGFLDEGLSGVAEELVFYQAGGMSPRSNATLSTNPVNGLFASNSRTLAFNSYVNQDFVRLRRWLQRPDTSGALKQNPGSLAMRGATWAFLRYASDRMNGDEQAFWYSLVNSNLQGVANIQNAIGGADPATWLRDFTAAMYADDAGFTVDAKYTQPSWNFRTIYKALNGSYPLAPSALATNVPVAPIYSAGGGAAYVRFGVTAGTFATLTATSPPATPYGLVVVRTK